MDQPEHVDVLIVGAGLSGVGSACHLRRSLPGKSFVILESRQAIGGTWDLFRYPGFRSDSDMFTLGYAFAPWPHDDAIGDGASILRYVRETADEYGLREKIRFGHRVVRAEWSSAEARWTVYARRGRGESGDAGENSWVRRASENGGDSGGAREDDQAREEVRLTCSFLYCCTGYYSYDEGYSPSFPGAERFAGEIVHPQHWPEGLDYEGKRVIVIGSGATAVTLVRWPNAPST
jgi:monooxygenase